MTLTVPHSIVGQVRAISVDGRKLLFCVDNLHVPLHELRDGGFELVKVDLLIVAASTGIERAPLKVVHSGRASDALAVRIPCTHWPPTAVKPHGQDICKIATSLSTVTGHAKRL